MEGSFYIYKENKMMSELMEDIRLKLENAIAEKLDGRHLSCAEIHELASAYMELYNTSFIWSPGCCNYEEASFNAQQMDS